ncbi:prolipoprotein diacylglyceryl transferase [Flavobacteriaceae bacterium Ap0902]|nr:prolipoprotein diacylglyceryl transferase [Flavobacteriaceae bacterium Ap0902]
MKEQLAYITYDGSGGIDLGFMTLHFYSLMWILAFLVGWFLMKKMFIKDNVSLDLLDPLFLYTFIGAIAGARLGEYLFYDPSAFIERPLEVFLPIQYSPGDSWLFLDDYRFVGFMGLASHGATLGLLIAMYLFTKKYLKDKSMLWLVDRLAIAVAIGGAFVRIGNFVNSEIVGKPSDAPWAVLFAQQSPDYGPIVPRHPAQLYEALGYILLFIITWFIYQKTDKKKQPGFIFGLFFFILWLIRFVVEFFKEDQGVEWVADTLNLNLNNGQILSIPFMLMGLIILFITNKKTIKK